MIKRTQLILLVAVMMLGSIPSAMAADGDFTLWRFCQRDPNTGWCVPEVGNNTRVQADNAKFSKFTEQLAAVLSPRYHAPAETLGWSGWNVGFEYTLSDIPGGEHWDDALEGTERNLTMNPDPDPKKSRSAPNLLNTVQFHVRKGLPFSTELGFNVTYLINSKMYLLGVEGKFAFVEGFEYVPDFAVRMNYSHLFGCDDMDLDILGWDLSISKNFGLGGFVQLAPYTGYSLVYSMVGTHVINPTFDAANNDRLLQLDAQNQIVHRWFIGLRLIASYFTFAPEITVTNVSVYNYSFNIGADF